MRDNDTGIWKGADGDIIKKGDESFQTYLDYISSTCEFMNMRDKDGKLTTPSLACGLRSRTEDGQAYTPFLEAGKGKAWRSDQAALGIGANVYVGEGSTAFGTHSEAKLDGTAFGHTALAIGEGSTAVGYAAWAKGRHSIAIGNGVAARDDYEVRLGSADNFYVMPGLARWKEDLVGDGIVVTDTSGRLSATSYDGLVRRMKRDLGSSADLDTNPYLLRIQTAVEGVDLTAKSGKTTINQRTSEYSQLIDEKKREISEKWDNERERLRVFLGEETSKVKKHADGAIEQMKQAGSRVEQAAKQVLQPPGVQSDNGRDDLGSLKRLDERNTQITKMVGDRNKDFDELSQRNDNTIEMVRDRNDDFDKLKQRNDETIKMVGDRDDEFNRLDTRNHQLKNEAQSLGEEFGLIESGRDNLKTASQRLHKRVDGHESRIQEVETKTAVIEVDDENRSVSLGHEQGSTHQLRGVTSEKSKAAQQGEERYLITSDADGRVAARPIQEFNSLFAAEALKPMETRLNALEGRFDDLAGDVRYLGQRMDRVEEGIAMALALASPLPDFEKLAFSVNLGGFADKQALSVSAGVKLAPNVILSSGLGLGLKKGSVGYRVGLSWAM